MKKLLFAVLVAAITFGAVNAFGRRNNCNGCPRQTKRARRTTCPTKCVRPACGPVRTECPVDPPRCTKTIKVAKTIMVDKCVDVAARKIVIPREDIIEYIPQPAREIRTPQAPIEQPDCITYECVPDKVVRRPRAPLIRYECPADCD